MDSIMIESTESVMNEAELSKDDAQFFLVKQRLQEQLDIAKLKSDHPDFDTQLLNTNLFADITKSTEIEVVRVLKSSVAGDSTFLNIALQFKNNNKKQNDTIVATIVSMKAEIEGEEIMTKKVIFK